MAATPGQLLFCRSLDSNRSTPVERVSLEMASEIKTTLIAGVDRSFRHFPISDKFSNEKFDHYLNRGGELTNWPLTPVTKLP